MTENKGPRSNRPLTQWACTNLGLFLMGQYRASGSRRQANTTVEYKITKRTQSFHVCLYDSPILDVFCDDWKVFSIRVSFTDFYDGYGRPTDTVRERLNGLLDRLSAFRLLPGLVRVFKDREFMVAYLGSGDEKVPVGRGYATSVFLKPDPERFVVSQTSEVPPSRNEDDLLA